jgi:hypothetical protein
MEKHRRHSSRAVLPFCDRQRRGPTIKALSPGKDTGVFATAGYPQKLWINMRSAVAEREDVPRKICSAENLSNGFSFEAAY